MTIKTLSIQGYRSIQNYIIRKWVTTHSQRLAQMIAKTSDKNAINLVNTDLGTQIEGVNIHEQFF
ncbi:MAG: hypothetical protein RLY40_957 [Pseudomonadota bacterium]|jgi:hypothetical protein